MLEHIVLLKLKEGTTESQTESLLEELNALKNRGIIPGMLAVSGGYNNSPEGRNLGFTFCFTIQFSDEVARDIYLPHPEHHKFGGKYVVPIAEDIFVFDYEHK